MSRDLNRCNFIGRLGKSPEMRTLQDGRMVANFSIAVGRDYKDKSGQKVEATEWVNICAFDKLAEICGAYLTKGSKVFISGQIRMEKYQDKATGKDLSSTKIIANEMQMLDGKGGESAPQRSSEGRSTPSVQDEKLEEFDPFDDIPF